MVMRNLFGSLGLLWLLLGCGGNTATSVTDGGTSPNDSPMLDGTDARLDSGADDSQNLFPETGGPCNPETCNGCCDGNTSGVSAVRTPPRSRCGIEEC